jgi:hypothetical protein
VTSEVSRSLSSVCAVQYTQAAAMDMSLLASMLLLLLLGVQTKQCRRVAWLTTCKCARLCLDTGSLPCTPVLLKACSTCCCSTADIMPSEPRGAPGLALAAARNTWE